MAPAQKLFVKYLSAQKSTSLCPSVCDYNYTDKKWFGSENSFPTPQDPSVRMSDINTSIISETLTPLHSSTFKLPSEEEITHADQENATIVVRNDIEVNTEERRKQDVIQMNNNNMIKAINHRSSLSDQKDENRNKLPKLMITDNEHSSGPVINIVNDLTQDKLLSDLMKRSPSTPKPHKPIMGRAALLKKANLERNDSLIIHELITNRYNSALTHHYSRMYQRRRSKIDSSEDEYSETVFSSPPNCSPMSFSSDDRSFSFPRNIREQGDLRFLKSTDDINIDTTIEDLDTSSLNSSAISNDKSTFSEYDPKKFLKEAIGEQTNVSSESEIDHDEFRNKTPEDFSVNPSDVSSLISKASSLYNSIRKSMKRNSVKLRTYPQDGDPSKSNRQSFVSGNSLLDNLMKELSIQNEILFQVSKAISYCRTKKDFENSVELIEAEKILLIASCTKDALSKEIENVEDDTYEKRDDPKSCGQVHLSNFKFVPKDVSKNDSHSELTEQFVMTLTYGSTVLASDVTVADESGYVHIEKNFEFQKLPPDFEILVRIYAMKVRNKPHHNQEHSCPSPKKFFLSKTSKKYKVINESVYIKPTSFLSWGKCEIRSSDLSKTKSTSTDSSASITLKMHNIPLSSSLSETFSLNLNSSVDLANKMRGFLTIGLDNEHGCIMWNVRWCVLEGSIMKYWNHPSEEGTTALGSFNLNYCLDQQISVVDRSLCARPRTLMVTVKYKEYAKTYLLSADNLSSMKEWEKELNYVLRALNMWNCGVAKLS